MDNIKPVKMNELLSERKRLLAEIDKVNGSIERCTNIQSVDGVMTVRSYDRINSCDSTVEAALMTEVLEKQKALYEKELEPTNKIINSIEIMLEAHQ